MTDGTVLLDKCMIVRVILVSWLLCASVAMSVSSDSLKGSCACGSVEFRVEKVTASTPAVDCHCPRCRKYHVSAFASYIVSSQDEVTVMGETVATFRDTCGELGEVERLYCTKCSSKVATRGLNDERVLVCMGSLDDLSIPKSLKKSWKKNRTPWQQESAAAWPYAVPKLTRHNLPATTQVTGSCSCGDCAYAITYQHPSELQHCYCKLCRQLSGSAFQTWVPVAKDDLVWTKPEPPLVRTTDHGMRHICKNCRGVLTIIYDEDLDYVWPAAGGFDDASLPDDKEKVGEYLDRVVHICCAWKQGWYQLPSDGLERIDFAC